MFTRSARSALILHFHLSIAVPNAPCPSTILIYVTELNLHSSVVAPVVEVFHQNHNKNIMTDLVLFIVYYILGGEVLH
jgi:hypothetical protein